MSRIFSKYSEQINGYIFILPAFLIISLFGIFPVFFGMYMSLHKWKVFKGRFLGFENYQKILGDISSFWIFILGLLIMIASYWVWSEYKDKMKNRIYCFVVSSFILLISLYLINISWANMMEKGDEDFLNSLIYIFYYSFFAITTPFLCAISLRVLFTKKSMVVKTIRIMIKATKTKSCDIEPPLLGWVTSARAVETTGSGL